MIPKVIDCTDCGYVHLDPKPTQEELDVLYRDEYYQNYNAGWFEKERREQWYWRKVYRQRLKDVESASFSSIKLVLDVGAGAGWFVKAIQFWNHYVAIGHEPNAKARRWARDVLKMPVFYWLHFADYDFVHCALVLEHVLDVMNTLYNLRRALRADGLLCIVVPNEFNPLQQQLAERYGYSPLHPHHVNYFDQGSIIRLVEKAGFEVVRVTSTFPMEWFALHGLNYVKHPKLGKIAHWLRMAIEWAALTVAPERWERVRDGWEAKGWGRETEIWARKV